MEQYKYKNCLQEYTQKSPIQLPLPVYQTINVGSVQAPRFISTVYVDGSIYKSSNTFSNRKKAEQDVARTAMEHILQKPKEDVFPSLLQFVLQDTSLCKAVLNEYAVKMNFGNPTYSTKQAQELVPVFVCDILLNGVNYTAQRARNKKEAERLAARAAILSILDSESRSAMSQIIKSKEKFYALLRGADVNLSGVDHNVADSGDNHSGLKTPLSKRKEVNAPEAVTTINSFNVGSSAIAQPFHEFKKPKVDPSPDVIPYPITFVPAGSLPSMEFLSCPSSGKKEKPQEEDNTQMTACAQPLYQAPPCSVETQ